MATITDVARKAGVSTVTVSRVLNDAPNVNPITRERVEHAIKDLGYIPNVVARSLRSKRTRMLALLVPDITNAFWTTVLRGVEDAASSRGYSVFVGNTDEDQAKQQRYLELVASQRVDGVIIAPCVSGAESLADLRSHGIATVVVDRHIEGWDVDTVTGDSLAGARALVGHLCRLGYQRIAIISGPAGTSTADDRLLGYYAALAEAGIQPDPRWIKRGEFRDTSGEQLTYQLLDDEAPPAAIFAANNAIAMGVIDALVNRGLRIPQDVALACFDDLATTSRLFPFLTAVVQPAYDMGLNAAQLLLSRLDGLGAGAGSQLKPRHVVLPARLMIRYSCGSALRQGRGAILSLPAITPAEAAAHESILVKPLSALDRRRLSSQVMGLAGQGQLDGFQLRSESAEAALATPEYEPDYRRLLRALRHQEVDRMPHLELGIPGRALCEAVLGREIRPLRGADETGEGQAISPDDHVDFAQSIGMDAVGCTFVGRTPAAGLAGRLSYLERYLRAAEGTGVGIYACFPAFFGAAWPLIAAVEAGDATWPEVEAQMDRMLELQERVVRVVCDRFGPDLAFVVVSDSVAGPDGPLLEPGRFAEVYLRRMRRLLAPVLEHGKLTVFQADGRMDWALATLFELGFSAVGPLDPGCNDLLALRRAWAGRLAFIGGLPVASLAHETTEQISERVKACCTLPAPGRGFVLGTAPAMGEEFPPAAFAAMIQAAHLYGRPAPQAGETAKILKIFAPEPGTREASDRWSVR